MRYKFNLEEIGERVYSLRKKKGISQETLGGFIDCGKNTVSKIERGELLGLSIKHLIDIANYFNVDVNYLLTGESDINIEIKKIFSSIPEKNRQIIKVFLERLLMFL